MEGQAKKASCGRVQALVNQGISLAERAHADPTNAESSLWAFFIV